MFEERESKKRFERLAEKAREGEMGLSIEKVPPLLKEVLTPMVIRRQSALAGFEHACNLLSLVERQLLEKVKEFYPTYQTLHHPLKRFGDDDEEWFVILKKEEVEVAIAGKADKEPRNENPKEFDH